MASEEEEEKEEGTQPDELVSLRAEFDKLAASQKEGHAWGTKLSQENAELRGRIDQISSQAAATPAAPATPAEDVYSFLNEPDLEEKLRNDPGSATALVRQAVDAMSKQFSSVMEARDAHHYEQLDAVTGYFNGKIAGMDPRQEKLSDQVKEISESGSIPGFAQMTPDQQLAIAEGMSSTDTETETEEEGKPMPARMNPPGGAGAGTSARTSAPKEIPMAEDPEFAGVLRAMGGLQDEETSAIVTPTVSGVSNG
jgi:hypothetical protein